MKKKELVELWNVLSEIGDSGEKMPKGFAYDLAKNRNKVKGEVDILTELTKPPAKLEEYDKERQELCHKFADKDEQDNPIIFNNTFAIKENKEVFDAAIEKLKEKYKDTLDKANKSKDEITEILEQETDITFHKIKLSKVPEEILQRYMYILEPLIIDDRE